MKRMGSEYRNINELALFLVPLKHPLKDRKNIQENSSFSLAIIFSVLQTPLASLEQDCSENTQEQKIIINQRDNKPLWSEPGILSVEQLTKQHCRSHSHHPEQEECSLWKTSRKAKQK